MTRAQARQFVNHAMFTVNGKKLNIPSYLTKVGDEIALKDNKQGKKIFEPITDQLSNAKAPSWLKVDPSAKKGSVLSIPLQEDVENVFDVKLIIEYYSTR